MFLGADLVMTRQVVLIKFEGNEENSTSLQKKA